MRNGTSLLVTIGATMPFACSSFSLRPPSLSRRLRAEESSAGSLLRIRSSSSPTFASTVAAEGAEAETVVFPPLPELGKNGVYNIRTEEQHRNLIEANKDKIVVLKAFAPWCRACKGLEPRFNKLVKNEQYEDVPIIWADISVHENKEFMTESLGVVALPTIQFYLHGQRADTFPCGPSKVPILKKKLAKLVDDNVDADTMTVKPPSEDSFEVAVEEDQTVSEDEKELLLKEHGPKLRDISYFSTMEESDFEAVLSKANLKTFESGSAIIREGDQGDSFYYLAEGDVEICQRTEADGDPSTASRGYLGNVINRLDAGAYFGERSLITGEARAASVRAASAVKVLAFARGTFPPRCALSGSSQQSVDLFERRRVDEKYGLDRAPSDDGGAPESAGAEEESIVPLLVRFKLIRSVTLCFDYIVSNRVQYGVESARRRRNRLVKMLTESQRAEFKDAFDLIDENGDGGISLLELRRLMDSIKKKKSNEELAELIETAGKAVEGEQVITYEDFMGLMAEAEIYNLLLETFRALDERGSGYVSARDLNQVLSGVQGLSSDDRKGVMDLEDQEILIDYKQFSKMYLGSSRS